MSRLNPRNDDFSRGLRGFGPVGLAAFAIILLIGPPWFRGLLVLIWAKWSRTPWRDLGFVRSRRWIGALLVAVGVGITLKLLLKAVVMPLLGADPINHGYHFLEANRAVLPGILFAVTIGAGFGEETVFRGYLFERLGRLLGHGKRATAAIVVISAVMFAMAHYLDQGLPGVEQAFVTGLVFGTMFAAIGELWIVMIAHAAFDLTAVFLIYRGLEFTVAHWLFK